MYQSINLATYTYICRYHRYIYGTDLNKKLTNKYQQKFWFSQNFCNITSTPGRCMTEIILYRTEKVPMHYQLEYNLNHSENMHSPLLVIWFNLLTSSPKISKSHCDTTFASLAFCIGVHSSRHLHAALAGSDIVNMSGHGSRFSLWFVTEQDNQQ